MSMKPAKTAIRNTLIAGVITYLAFSFIGANFTWVFEGRVCHTNSWREVCEGEGRFAARFVMVVIMLVVFWLTIGGEGEDNRGV